MRIWTSNEKNDDKIIVYYKHSIYKANPPSSKLEDCLFELKLNKINSKYFLEIPLHYISQITLQEGKQFIEVNFRGDYELLSVTDSKIRHEIFEYFSQNIPGVQYSIKQQSKIQAIKKPLIAFVVTNIIFIWSLYIAVEIEKGNQYDVAGQHYHSIAGIILIIASLGANKIILIFSILILIILISIVRKYKHPIIKKTLTITH